MEVDKKAVGKRIRSLRLSLGYNTREFAEIFNPEASDSIVSRWEKGINLPNNQRLVKIAEMGGKTVEELLHGNFLADVPTEQLLAEITRRLNNDSR